MTEQGTVKTRRGVSVRAGRLQLAHVVTSACSLVVWTVVVAYITLTRVSGR